MFFCISEASIFEISDFFIVVFFGHAFAEVVARAVAAVAEAVVHALLVAAVVALLGLAAAELCDDVVEALQLVLEVSIEVLGDHLCRC